MTNAADLIGTAEAAKLLGKSPRTVHRMVQAGTLVPDVIAPGGPAGAYLFHRDSIVLIAQRDAA